MSGTLPARTLGRTGVGVTALGLGTAPLGNLYRQVSEAAARETVDTAIELGIRYFERDVNIEVRGCELLEYGCGAGAMCFGFEEKGARVTGVDVNPRVLGVARRWAAHRKSSGNRHRP